MKQRWDRLVEFEGQVDPPALAFCWMRAEGLGGRFHLACGAKYRGESKLYVRLLLVKGE